MRLCTSLGPMIESLAERFANLKSGPPPRAIALGPPAPITSILLVAWLASPVKWVRPDFHPTRLNVLLLLSDLLAHLFPLLRIEIGADDDRVAGHGNCRHNGTDKASKAPALQWPLVTHSLCNRSHFFASVSFFSSSCFSYNLSSPVTSRKIGGQI